jgi:hypothetical protein
MTRPPLLRSLLSTAPAAALVTFSALASAQAPPLSESYTIGGWTFRPSLEVRLRGEYRRHPIDTGGAVYDSTAVLSEGFSTTLPTVVDTQKGVGNQYLLSERSRLGLAVDRGPVTAALILQDARVWGNTDNAFVGPGQPLLPAFAPFEAYLDVHTESRSVWARLGRQRVTWGEGRLVGANDWSLTGRSLDAARMGFKFWIIDLEFMAALLASPGSLPPNVSGTKEPVGEGTGAQLYGVDMTWRILPLLNIELTGLARIVRQPHPAWLTPSDTFVADGRIFGDRRGFRYALEGAYEFGRVASYGADRTIQAYAFAGRVSWETALPGHLTFGADGAYATGDKGSFSAKEPQRRFDPILPDEHQTIDPMNMFAWSNIMAVGGTIGVTPVDKQNALANGDRVEFSMQAGYHFVNLAEPKGRWTTAQTIPVGAEGESKSRTLGHEADIRLRVSPWRAIEFEGGYGFFLFGDKARAILLDASRPARWQHWAYLQAVVRAP